MTGKKLQRVLACLLAVLLLSQVGAFSPAVFAADASGYTLQDGTAIIPEGASEEKVNQILTRTLVAGFDEMSKEDQNTLLSTCKWEYYCKSKASRWHEAKDAWGSVGGFNFKEGIYTYDFLALSDAKTECKAYSVRLTTATDKTVQFTKAAMLDSSITLKEGVTVTLPYNADVSINFDALRERIFDQVVESTTPDMTVNDVTIEYYATATKGAVGDLGHDWVSLEGGKVSIYDYPAISEGNQQIRISYAGNGTYGAVSAEVTVTFADRADSSIVLKSGQKVALPYNDDVTVNYDALRAAILQQIVDEGTTPSLTAENTEIKYYATATTGAAVGLGKNWAPLEGGKVDGLNYPAISAGDQQIQISFKGDDAYKASSATTTVTFTERPGIEVTTNENPTFKLAFTADGAAIYDNIRQKVWDAVVVSTNPTLTVDDVTIEYYATAESGSFVGAGKAWMPLEGGTKDLLTYPAIGEGTQEVRITWGGSKDNAAWQWQGNVAVTGRADAPFRFKEGVTEGMTVAMAYNRDQSINYEETARALRDALLESTGDVSIDEVTVQYNAGTDVIKNYQPLNYSPTGSDFIDQFVKFDLGSQTIHFAWNGNADYKPLKLDDVTVNMDDHRIASAVVLKSGVSITYNMDANVMLQAIFENLIDWDASTLPEKGTLSAADFTIEYYGENVLGEEDGGISGGVPNWAPVAGGTVKTLKYPQMGAGEQQIRVIFKGDEAYQDSKPSEGKLTVNKAKVSVKVHSTSIYAEEAKDKLGEGFVTTDPADKFDIYTIYGGMTSDVTTSVFVQLPERIRNNKLLKLIDDTLSAVGKPTLSDIMQKGTTVGELKVYLNDILNSNELTVLRGLLSKIGIDLDTLRQISDTLTKFPGLLDNVRVAFGTPDQAGIYTVYAITNNKNYETGFGMGALVVKKHYSGVKLQWNQTIPNGKLTAEKAADFDFGATLSYNGDNTISQSNVKYLYSGFTSKWKPYSSTETPPTEPGRYVMTVVTLGGNYQAAPITRAFQITK